MCEVLWPDCSAQQHAQELQLLTGGQADRVLTMPLILFVAELDGGALVGFVEVDLRSHADGCDPAQAVGYIEGWYRNQSVKKLLVRMIVGRTLNDSQPISKSTRPGHGTMVESKNKFRM